MKAVAHDNNSVGLSARQKKRENKNIVLTLLTLLRKGTIIIKHNWDQWHESEEEAAASTIFFYKNKKKCNEGKKTLNTLKSL